MCDICDNVSENGEQEERLMERKYPQNWFWAFVFTNFLFHYSNFAPLKNPTF